MLAQVPPGQVVSYGQLAELAGLRPRRPLGRQDAQPVAGGYPPALASGSRRRRSHQPAGGQSRRSEQRARLREEGVLHNDRWTYVGMAGLQRSRAVRVRVIFAERYPMTQQSWREALVAYKSPASLALLLLGFAAGLPTMLVFNTCRCGC